MRKAQCECFAGSRVYIILDESPVRYFYRLHLTTETYELCCILQEILCGIRCKLGATRSADFFKVFKQMIRIPVWSRFGSLEVWKTMQKATTQCNYRHSYFFPRGKERQVRIFLSCKKFYAVLGVNSALCARLISSNSSNK